MRRFAVAASLLLLAACGSKEPEADKPPRQARNEVTVAGFSLPGSVDERNWRRFEQNVNAWAPEFRLKMLIRGEGGPEETQFSNLRRGRVQIVGGSLAGAAAIVPELAVLQAPYLFESQAEADYVMDEVLLEPFRRIFAEQGLRLIQWLDIGWVNLYARKPILTPADARGARLRAASSVASQEFVAAIGGDLITLPFPDILPALQTGLIDGGVTTITMYSLSGLATEAPHYVLTEHSYDVGLLLANRPWFDRLTPHDRDVFMQAFGSAGQARSDARAAVGELFARLESVGGVTVHRPDPEQRRAWAEAARPAHEAIVRKAGGRSREIYDLILKGKAEFAARQAGQS
jgi:TRAP-type C4-dicarboxylate transport system substrate-binding protein